MLESSVAQFPALFSFYLHSLSWRPHHPISWLYVFYKPTSSFGFIGKQSLIQGFGFREFIWEVIPLIRREEAERTNERMKKTQRNERFQGHCHGPQGLNSADPPEKREAPSPGCWGTYPLASFPIGGGFPQRRELPCSSKLQWASDKAGIESERYSLHLRWV